MNVQKMSPWFIKPIVNGICGKVDGFYLGPNTETHLEFLEGELKQRTWLAGEQFSGADIQVINLIPFFICGFRCFKIHFQHFI